MTTPRYLRFAQALALCSGLATVPACPSSTTNTIDSGPPGTDAPLLDDAPSGVDAPSTGTDAPVAVLDAPGTVGDAPATADDAPVLADAGDVDGGNVCETCDCVGPIPFDSGPTTRPDCWSVPGGDICCAVIGPLSPPNLPA